MGIRLPLLVSKIYRVPTDSIIIKTIFHGRVLFAGRKFSGSFRRVSLERISWMPERFPLEMSGVRSFTECAKNTFSATSDRRKSAGFKRISSGAFFVSLLVTKKESENTRITQPIEA